MEEQNNHNSIVLKELSDIKASLAVNTSETGNMKNDIKDIKVDIKEIKNDFVNRRELNETANTIRSEFKDLPGLRKDVEDLKEFRWKLAGVTSLAAAGMTFVGQLIIKYLTK